MSLILIYGTFKSTFQNSDWKVCLIFNPRMSICNAHVSHPASGSWIPCINHWLSPTVDSAQCTHLQERLHRRQTVWNHIGIITHQSQQFKRIMITWRQTIISLSRLSHWFRWFYSAIDHFESFTIYTACVAFSIITFLFSFRTIWQAGLHTLTHHLVEINEFILSWD